MICITPMPSAASSAADGLPGRYKFASPWRSAEGRCSRVRFRKNFSPHSTAADAASSTSSTITSPTENTRPTSAESDSVVAIKAIPASISRKEPACTGFLRTQLQIAGPNPAAANRQIPSSSSSSECPGQCLPTTTTLTIVTTSASATHGSRPSTRRAKLSPPSSPKSDSVSRRRIRLGRMPRMSSSGGSVNSNVVRIPAPSPVKIALHCRCNSVGTLISLPSTIGNASCTATPSSTPSSPPASPSSSVCSR